MIGEGQAGSSASRQSITPSTTTMPLTSIAAPAAFLESLLEAFLARFALQGLQFLGRRHADAREVLFARDRAFDQRRRLGGRPAGVHGREQRVHLHLDRLRPFQAGDRHRLGFAFHRDGHQRRQRKAGRQRLTHTFADQDFTRPALARQVGEGDAVTGMLLDREDGRRFARAPVKDQQLPIAGRNHFGRAVVVEVMDRACHGMVQFGAAELRLGADKAAVVRIERTDGVGSTARRY